MSTGGAGSDTTTGGTDGTGIEGTGTTRSRALLPLLAMVAVTAVWGSTFVVVKDAVARIPVLDFLAWRFLLAAAVMVVVRPHRALRLDRRGLLRGGLLGLLLAGGFVSQTYGLFLGTPASVSGFVTGMYVVFTPLLLGLLFRNRIGGRAWIAVALATLGLGLTSLHGVAFGPGVPLTLLCALCFALHIVGLSRWSHRHDSWSLAVVQIGTVGITCLLLAAGTSLAGGNVRLLAMPPDAGVWAALAVTAVLATAFGFLVQTWAQREVAPTRIAIVMTTEPVFAAVFGVLAGERLGWTTVLGGVLVLAAMYLVELGARPRPTADTERLEI